MSKIFGASVSASGRDQEAQWGTMHWLVEEALIDRAELSVARMILNEGAHSERHRHPNCNEVIYLVQGTVEQSIGTERFVMEAGDTAFISQGSVHGSRNIGCDDATMIVCYSAGRRIYEAAGDNEPHER